MCALQIFLSVDPSLGKVDYSLMSDQTLMEMLFEGFDDETKKANQDNNGMYRDVCEWSCIKCDADERIIEINIGSRNLSGSLELRYVPPQVKLLKISSWVKRQLTGSVDLTQLPEGMQKLYLCRTAIKGEINLEHLPKDMEDLSLQSNQLTGEINLTHLPERMERLFLQNNQFKGEIDLAHLPSAMKSLSLENNLLSGSLVIKNLPQGMVMLDVGANHFNAIAVVDSNAHGTIKFEGGGVTSVVDKDGREVDIKRFLW